MIRALERASQNTSKEEKGMKKNVLLIMLAGMLLLSACGGGMKNASGKLEANNYWARAAMKDGNSAAYMMLSNGLAQDVEIVGASSDVANAVEVHLSTMENGVMKMQKQESVLLPAGQMLELKPGSYHVMLIGLKRELKVGEEITVTLHFKNHDDITLTVPVKDAADMGGSGMDGHAP